LEGFGINQNWDFVLWGSLSLCQVFVLLTDTTAFDVVGNSVFHPWPMKYAGDLSNSFISSRVSGSGEVMPFSHDGPLDFIVRWDD
jgi:hypothetical protein